MLNTNNLKVGEVVIVQKDDCFYLAEIVEILPKNKLTLISCTGNHWETASIRVIHKILNNYAFNITRKNNKEEEKC